MPINLFLSGLSQEVRDTSFILAGGFGILSITLGNILYALIGSVLGDWSFTPKLILASLPLFAWLAVLLIITKFKVAKALILALFGVCFFVGGKLLDLFGAEGNLLIALGMFLAFWVTMAFFAGWLVHHRLER